MTFVERLQAGEVMIFDGAMGSLLVARGADGKDGNANLKHPQIVQGVHRDYLAAGANCLITNSLTLNEIYMGKQGELAILDDALTAAAENALEAAAHSRDTYVFGDMGAAGDLLAPYGPGEPGAYLAAFQRQAATLAALPITGFIIETVFQLAEAELMLQACREVAPGLPVICSLTFSSIKRGCRTIMGDAAAPVAAKAAELGAIAVGSNCGDLTPEEQANVMREMAGAGLPLIVQPNAGKPEVSGGQVSYNLSPEAFAEGLLVCREAGAQLLGGCCGTTPAHIAALCQVLGR